MRGDRLQNRRRREAAIIRSRIAHVNTQNKNRYAAHRKAIPIVVAVMITAAISGYFMGLRQIASTSNGSRTTETIWSPHIQGPVQPIEGAPVAVDYSQMAGNPHRPNANWTQHLDNLLTPPPAPPPSQPATAAARTAAREKRAANRAYDGAPPTIPHPIDQLSSMSCLACHDQGAVIKDRVATKISHPHWGSCTQCHVPATGIGLALSPGLDSAFPQNDFRGVFPPPEGNRAYPEAPPTIPHAVSLRKNCLSCHGPTGEIALRTTHPERQSCMQCHAPSAHLDQHILISGEQTLEEFWNFINGSEKEDGS
jgi:nitrate reductase (cytochrome), electron transfer subunit